MNAERETFGFFFSAHPVEQFRNIAAAQGARSYMSLMDSGAPPGGRANAAMAAMVEGVRIGKTKRGNDFIRADFSDSTGQFSAACFEEGLVEPFRKWAADGTCILLQVELDSPSADEPPRITVRGARPLAEVSGSVPMLLTMDLADEGALAELATRLGTRGGNAEVRVRLPALGEGAPTVRLGRDFAIDGTLADELEQVPGISAVMLKPLSGRERLRLVA